MKFNIVSLGDYLKNHDLKTVGGKKVMRRHNGRIIIGCAYCKKTGLDYDGVQVCSVCRGKKKVLVEEPVVMCAFCKGRGSSNGVATVCRVCDGKGLVHVNGPIEKCPECHGRGKITGTDLMCIKCGGKGVVVEKITVNNGKGELWQ